MGERRLGGHARRSQQCAVQPRSRRADRDWSLEILRIHRPTYKKQKVVSRLIWTMVSKILLLRGAFSAMRRADAVLFTGSPPLMLHFIAPLNLFLRKKLIYRITDFHPECLIAERGRAGFVLGLLLRLTQFWRRRIDQFEALGFDQARRLAECGIEADRIVLKRDPSPVTFPPGLSPLPLPDELKGASGVILYSGNWGVAHDESTFIHAYAQYFGESARPSRFLVECNRRESRSRCRRVARQRSAVLPIELGSAGGCASTAFRGRCSFDYASRSIRGLCAAIEGARLHRVRGKSILFVGSQSSDVHLLASEALPDAKYHRIDVGDVNGLVQVLHQIERGLKHRAG